MGYWTVYWFQSLACFGFATTATFSGITGSALMLPWFLMGFPLLGVPEITIVQAIAASMFLETAAFSIGVYQYWHRGLIDMATAKKLAIFVLPASILGALVTHWAPEVVLRVIYSTLLLVAVWLLLKKGEERERQRHESCDQGEARKITARDGTDYRFCVHGMRTQRFISGGGGFFEGMISTGIGEATMPSLILRSGYPIPVAAATSVVLVAVADLSGALTHFVQFTIRGEAEIPWNLIVWGVPGMAMGAYLGARLQGKISESATRKFFAGLYAAISVIFLVYTFTARE